MVLPGGDADGGVEGFSTVGAAPSTLFSGRFITASSVAAEDALRWFRPGCCTIVRSVSYTRSAGKSDGQGKKRGKRKQPNKAGAIEMRIAVAEKTAGMSATALEAFARDLAAFGSRPERHLRTPDRVFVMGGDGLEPPTPSV